MNSNNNTTRATDFAWELPNQEEPKELDTPGPSPLFLDEQFEVSRDATCEEDPLVALKDEEEAAETGKGEEEKMHTNPAQKKKKIFLAVLVLVGLLIGIPAILLTVDKNKARQRLRTPGAVHLDSLSVDVSQPLPVVGLELSVQKSAFPKFTHLQPKKLECSLIWEWGNILVATIEELKIEDETDGDEQRTFFLNATLVPPEPNPDLANLQNVTQTYATIAWEVLTQQRTFVGNYNCQLHVQVQVFGTQISWHHEEREAGAIDLKGLWEKKPATQKHNLDSDRASHIPGPSSFTPTGMQQQEKDEQYEDGTDDCSELQRNGLPCHINGVVYYDGSQHEVGSFHSTSTDEQYEDGTDDCSELQRNGLPCHINGVVYYDGSQHEVGSFHSTSTSNSNSGSSTSGPSTPRPTPSPTTTNTYSNNIIDMELPYRNNHDEEDNEQGNEPGKEGDSTNTDAINVYNTQPNSVPPPGNAIIIHQLNADGILMGVRIQLPNSLFQMIPQIQVHLPPIVLNLKQLKLAPEAQALVFSLEELNLDFSTQSNEHYALAQVGCGSDSGSCPWYNPLINLLQDTKKTYNSMLSVTINANNGSFLEQMIGAHHDIELYRIQSPHFFSHNPAGRRHLNEDVIYVDCVRAQDALFGDVLDLNWCMNLDINEGIAVDGSVNFYGYGGSISGDLAWQHVIETTSDDPDAYYDEDLFRLDGAAKLGLELGDADEDTKMDISLSAILDIENLKLALFANNTADWWPFRLILEGGIEYDDPIDAVLFRLVNGTFEFDNEQYLHATGAFTLNNLEEKISAVIDDPRLEMAMDGSVGDDKLVGTWKLVYDGEDIMTGEGDISVVDNGEGLKVEAESKGKLTVKVKAEATATDDQLSMEVSKGQMKWDGDAFADVEMSMRLDDNGISMALEEKTYDHEVGFNVEVANSDDLKMNGKSSLRILGKNVFSSDMKVRLGDDGMELDVEGEVPDHEYSLSVETEWNSDYPNWVQFEVKDAVFSVDRDPWMDMSGSFRIAEPDDQDMVFGELAIDGKTKGDHTFELQVDGELFLVIDDDSADRLSYEGNSRFTVNNDLLWSENGRVLVESGDFHRGKEWFSNAHDYFAELTLSNTANQADVQLEAVMNCGWGHSNQTLSCGMSQMVFAVLGTVYTDSTGNMSIATRWMPNTWRKGVDLGLYLKDDYTNDNDNDGFLISMNCTYDTEDMILKGRMDDFVIVSDGESKWDATFQMNLNLNDISIGYDFQDIISENLMALDYGGMSMMFDDWDNLETMGIRAENARMVMMGDPYIFGGMNLNLDLVASTISMALSNNTTKLPIDMSFKLGFGDDQISVAANAVSSRPPSPPTPAPLETVDIDTAILLMNLEGLTAELLNGDPENAAVLAKAFGDFVDALIAALEGTVDMQKRQLLSTRRRLEVNLLPGSATVYDAVDIDCPADMPQDAKCQTVMGKYELVVVDEDPENVYELYVQATDRAVAEGKLQERLEAADPDYPVFVVGPVERTKEDKPVETAIPVWGPETEAPASGSPETVIPVWGPETEAPASGSPAVCAGVTVVWLSLFWWMMGCSVF